MTTVYWSPDYAATAVDFDTTRKSGWIAESLDNDPISGIELIAPPLLSESELAEVHDDGYIKAVRTGTPRALAESQGFHWDPGLWTMARAHTSGMVAAAMLALTSRQNAGSLSSGQHHAARGRGAGFCTFNGIALAARRVLQAGAGSVLIIDTDAHCAGGTHSLITGESRIRQMDIAVNPFDSYVPSRPNSHDLIESAAEYLPTFQNRLNELDAAGERFDLCIYYAGMDPFHKCGIGGLPGIDVAIIAQREWMVFEWCRERRLPIAFGIGGGYVNPDFPREELVALHRLTLEAAVGKLSFRGDSPPPH